MITNEFKRAIEILEKAAQDLSIEKKNIEKKLPGHTDDEELVLEWCKICAARAKVWEIYDKIF